MEIADCRDLIDILLSYFDRRKYEFFCLLIKCRNRAESEKILKLFRFIIIFKYIGKMKKKTHQIIEVSIAAQV